MKKHGAPSYFKRNKAVQEIVERISALRKESLELMQFINKLRKEKETLECALSNQKSNDVTSGLSTQASPENGQKNTDQNQ